MKKWSFVFCILITGCLLTACGYSFEPSISSLYIQKDGKLTQAIVESFERPFFSLSEFEAMAEKEIGAFNSSCGEDKITVQQLEVKNDALYFLLDYADAEAYEQYNDATCFLGTVEEAIAEGYSFHMDFKNADYVEYSAAEVTGNKKGSVAVLKEEGVVELEKKVKYVSNNVEFLSDHMVQVMSIEADDEYAYIIY